MKGYTSIFLYRLLLPFIILLALSPLTMAEDLRIGVIMTGDVPYYAEMHKAFMGELNRQFGEGEKIEVILQRPFPDQIAWSNAARKLIAIEVDLIVSYGSPATLAVLEEDSRIPVVYAGVYDPESINITGRDVTGSGYKVPLSSLVRYLKRLKDIDTLSVVYSSVEEDSVRQADELVKLAGHQSLKMIRVNIRTKGDIEKLRKVKEDDAVILTGSSLVHLWIEEVMTLLRSERDPVADIFPDIDREGVLMTLCRPPAEQGKITALMAARILNGEKAREIAPESHGDTELVFNLIEARKIGIEFPVGLVIEATRVIK